VFFSESENNHPLAADMIPLPHKVWLMVSHHPVTSIEVYRMTWVCLGWACWLFDVVMVMLVSRVNMMLFGGMMFVRHCPFLCLSYVKLCCQ